MSDDKDTEGKNLEDKDLQDVAEPLLEIDKRVCELALPFRSSAPVKALAWCSQIGDQPQLRILSGGTAVLGLIRGDRRMMRAGVRMLIAHEVATHAKTFIKHRIIRSRPNSAATEKDHKPYAGRDTSKARSSFPSGHSAGSIAVARALSTEYPEYETLAISTAGAVALAQIPRCSHYPSDVAAGLMIGVVAEALVKMAGRAVAAALPEVESGRGAVGAASAAN